MTNDKNCRETHEVHSPTSKVSVPPPAGRIPPNKNLSARMLIQ